MTNSAIAPGRARHRRRSPAAAPAPAAAPTTAEARPAPDRFERLEYRSCRALVGLVHRRAELRGVGLGSAIEESVRWNA